MAGRSVVEQLADAYRSREQGAEPDDECNSEPGDVLSSSPPVRVRGSRRALRDAKPDEDGHRRAHIREVVKGVTEQSN